jgi:Lrp/AsnC family transcriptional regulator for asnA, asnC and gidA
MPSAVPAPSANGLLDQANKAIVEELQKDGRRTYGSIAEAVGLSEAAVRQRVQKLREAGIMQIVAVTDPLQVGFRSQAMVGIRADGDARLVAERLAEVSDIDYVVMCTG